MNLYKEVCKVNKNEFLSRLRTNLSSLSPEEIKKTIDYYSEIIDDAVEDGMSEDEITSKLGLPEEIAKKTIGEAPTVKTESKARSMGAGTITLIVIGSPVWLPLLIGAFAVVFSLYIAAWSIILSLFAVFLSLAVSAPVLLITSPFLFPVKKPEALAALALGLICAGLAVYMFYLSVGCSKRLIGFTVFAAEKIKGIFKKRGCAQI